MIATFERRWMPTGRHPMRMSSSWSIRFIREEAVLEYPRSGERIRGRRNIRASRVAAAEVRSASRVRRIDGAGDLWVTEFMLAYDGRPSYCGQRHGVPGWQGGPRDAILCRPVRAQAVARANGLNVGRTENHLNRQDPACDRRLVATVGRLRRPSLEWGPDMTEQSNKPDSIDAQPTANGDASAAHESKSAQTPPESSAAPQEARKATWKRKLLVGVARRRRPGGSPRVRHPVGRGDAQHRLHGRRIREWARDVCRAPRGRTDFPRSGG